MQINSHLSVLIHDLAKKQVGVLLALFFFGITAQAQIVSFTYDSAGGVVSRVVKEAAQQEQALSEEATDMSDVLDVKVSPYPKLSGELTVDCSYPKQKVSQVTYALSNTFGQVYLQGNLKDGVNHMNTSQLPAGIYLLKIECSENTKSFRLIKE